MCKEVLKTTLGPVVSMLQHDSMIYDHYLLNGQACHVFDAPALLLCERDR